MKTKIVLWSIVSVLIAGIAVGAFLWLSRPQTVMLSDGTKLTLLGVEYGKHHVAPKIKTANGRARGDNARIDSTNDTLVVWVQSEHKPNQGPNCQLMVYDPANTACVSSWSRMNTQIKNGVDVQGFMLDAFPRRGRKIDLRVAAWNNNGGGMKLSKGQFVISNPARGSFAKWFPDSLPNTQSDGDFDVTLTRLISGVQGFNGSGNQMKNDPMNKAVLAAFRTEQKGVVVTNWQPVRIETSDATGNQVMNNSWSNTREGDEAVMTYQWGLWPDEAAWKLRVEMSRTSGFNDDELWTVENVPVQPGRQMDFWNYGNNNNKSNAPFAETTLDGVHLKLYPATQFTDQIFNGQKQGGFRIIADPPPADGYRMTLAKATDEQGREIQSWNPSWGGGNYGFQLQNIRNAKFLNITVALHKSRFVEFTAKPAKQ
jgi:hypothetical protein